VGEIKHSRRSEESQAQKQAKEEAEGHLCPSEQRSRASLGTNNLDTLALTKGSAMPLPRKKKKEAEDLIIYVEFYDDGLTDQERELRDWRTDQLVEAGVDRSYAVAIAAIGDLDLHEAVELKAKGCSDVLLYKLLS
jgi:hypothetical protein